MDWAIGVSVGCLIIIMVGVWRIVDKLSTIAGYLNDIQLNTNKIRQSLKNPGSYD